MSPGTEYEARLADRRGRVAAQDRLHVQLGNIRLLLGVSAAVIAYSAFVHHALNPLWLFAPVAVFVPILPIHSRVLRKRTLAARAVLFYEHGLARMADKWAGTGEQGLRLRDPLHPYADDLDLFGHGSLFELLSQARTRGGEDTLAGWLLHPADPETIRRRQQSVAELKQYLDLRESLFVLGEDARDTVHTSHLVAWAGSSPLLDSSLLWSAAALLSLNVAVSAFAAWYLDFQRPLLFALLAVTLFGYWLRKRVLAVITTLDEAVHDLHLLSSLLELIEKQPFESPHLLELRRRLTASQAIRRLHHLAELVDSRDNPLIRVAGPPLLYGTHLAFAVERWRAAFGPHVGAWLEALSEFEALLSIAGYAAEHPSDPFPEIVSEKLIDGVDLGHPLLPADKCVCNSVHLDANLALLCVSGSNMSGKSTYLRTIGINVVLAMAGAPIRGRKLRLSPFTTGAAIRVTDSLQGGTSRFYAELKRLRQVLDLAAGEYPILFLLDELLSGTNSHDRKIGAEGVLRELLDRGALGLITTHDLALTAIAEALQPRAANVHFEDTLQDGQLHFDYRLRPGVVQKSNALELMRSIGLDV
ncbi:MAG: DNA mismatch repair protein MutS [Bryobacterales bacterium]|nr:DNA mismatch repair protein MutS [Bryobacterales bacterium]